MQGQSKVKLEEVEKGILGYAKTHHLVVLNAKPVSQKILGATIEWDNESGDWEKFLDGMRSAGSKTLTIYRERLDHDALVMVRGVIEAMLDAAEPEDEQELHKDKLRELDEIESHSSDIGSLNILVSVEGNRWLYRKASDWFEKWSQLQELYEDVMDGSDDDDSVDEEGDDDSAAGTKYIENTSAANLGSAARDALIAEYGNADQWKVAPQTFWRTHLEGRGVAIYSLTGKLANKLVEAEREFDRCLRESASELLQKLAADLAAWAKDKKMSRVSQAEVDMYLSEKGQEIRKQSKHIVWTKANLLLNQGV